MVALETPQADIGWRPRDFELKGTDDQIYDLNKAMGENGLVIVFMCNHCPFVQAIFDKIIRDAKALAEHGIGFLAINSNDAEQYPDDSYENMIKLAEEKNFPFPYVYDETQQVAKDFGAVCTPDFFGFDKNGALKYRGRLDDSGMENKPDGHRDLFEAMVEIAEKGSSSNPQLNSIGCSIKWA